MDNRLPQEKEFIEQKLGIMDPIRQKASRRNNTHQIQACGYLWGKRTGKSSIKGL